MKKTVVAAILVPLFLLSGCATYTRQYAAFRPPEAYANRQVVDGVSVAAEAYPDKEAAEKAFGFDVRGAGVLPVQLVLDNTSGQSLEMVSSQTFLEDDNGGYWTIMPNHVAVDRIDKFTQGGAMAAGAGKGAVVGAVAGGILGAAIGIVSGHNVGSAMGGG
ncbi:MAG TPA: glycine zipper family protein, partial [Geobacteraceae bacterium]